MKILLLSILLLPVSLNSSLPQSKPVYAPEALCTAGVEASECKALTGLLAFRQLGGLTVQLTQFVVADDAAYRAEKQRIETLRDNLVSKATGKTQERAFAAPDYLISGPSETLFELKESNHMTVSKIYINETTACHEPLPSTGSGAFNVYQCAAELEYAMGFVDGILQGSNNVMNSLAIGK